MVAHLIRQNNTRFLDNWLEFVIFHSINEEGAMFKKNFSFRAVWLILFMLSVDLRSVKADGLPPEEALPTAKAEEAALPPPAEETEPEPGSEENVAVSSKALPEPLKKAPPAPAVTVKPPELDLWSSVFYGTILSDPQPDGKIVGSKDKKMMLGEGDTVYLVSFKGEFSPGKDWIIYKFIKNVYHPTTGKYLGDLIDVTGVVKVTEVDKKLATAQIIRSKEPIFQDDQIALVETLFDLSRPANRLLPEGMTATIVEARDNRLNNATHDVVYIDRGKKEGIVRGDQFVVITGGQQIGVHPDGQTLRFPQREVGSLVILSSQDHTATAQILKSSEPISKGNPLLFHFLK